MLGFEALNIASRDLLAALEASDRGKYQASVRQMQAFALHELARKHVHGKDLTDTRPLEPLAHFYLFVLSATESYSASFADLFVTWIMDSKPSGYFVEVRGGDVSSQASNCRLLHRALGWQGMDLVVPTCHTSDSQPEAFDGRSFVALRADDGLNASLRDHKAPHQVDYLSVSVSHGSLDLLRSFDFTERDIQLATVACDEQSQVHELDAIMRRGGLVRVLPEASDTEAWFVKDNLWRQVVNGLNFQGEANLLEREAVKEHVAPPEWTPPTPPTIDQQVRAAETADVVDANVIETRNPSAVNAGAVAAVERLQVLVQHYEQQLEERSAELSVLQDKLAASRERIAKSQVHASEAARREDVLQQKLALLEEHLANAREQASNLQMERAEAQDEYRRLEAAVEELRVDFEALVNVRAAQAPRQKWQHYQNLLTKLRQVLLP